MNIKINFILLILYFISCNFFLNAVVMLHWIADIPQIIKDLFIFFVCEFSFFLLPSGFFNVCVFYSSACWCCFYLWWKYLNFKFKCASLYNINEAKSREKFMSKNSNFSCFFSTFMHLVLVHSTFVCSHRVLFKIVFISRFCYVNNLAANSVISSWFFCEKCIFFRNVL